MRNLMDYQKFIYLDEAAKQILKHIPHCSKSLVVHYLMSKYWELHALFLTKKKISMLLQQNLQSHTFPLNFHYI